VVEVHGLPSHSHQVHVRLSPALHAAAARVAAEQGRTFAGHLRWLIVQSVRAHDERDDLLARLRDDAPEQSETRRHPGSANGRGRDRDDE
jgi:hypothetical protein